MSRDEIERIAQGRVWSGFRAHKIGLVDTLGGLITALKLAKKMARLPAGEGIGIVVYPPRKSLLERLRDEYVKLRWFSDGVLKFPDQKAARHHFSSGEILSLMPYRISIR